MRLRINNIDCYYEDTKVLENVVLNVDKGEFVGIIGPNGSGKTTLLRCISRVLKPKTGTVLIDDRDVYKLPSKVVAKHMGTVPQESPITAEFTAFEIVLMGRTPYAKRFKFETSADFEIVKKCMIATDTWHLRDRFITELSGGEKQRVIIAKALAQQPSVLLLDEPTVHLDISYQYEILELVKKLTAENNITVVGVFHDINLAAQYSEKLVLLSKGKIVSIGLPEEVLTPENIKSAYNIDVVVEKNTLTNTLFVYPFFVCRKK